MTLVEFDRFYAERVAPSLVKILRLRSIQLARNLAHIIEIGQERRALLQDQERVAEEYLDQRQIQIGRHRSERIGRMIGQKKVATLVLKNDQLLSQQPKFPASLIV